MLHLVRRCGALVMAVAPLVACSNKLPTGPSDGLVDGIVVYEDANFLGRSAHITTDIRDLRDFEGPCEHRDGTPGIPGDNVPRFDWNDCISSVRVAQGWRATLYRDDGFRDDSLEITTDVPNLQLVDHDCPHGGLNDCVTSIRVRRQ